LFYPFNSFDANDVEVQSDGDDDEEVNGNDSEEEGVYNMSAKYSYR